MGPRILALSGQNLRGTHAHMHNLVTYILIICMFQRNSSVCTPKGIECYENITINENDCKIPCEGLYADILHIQDTDFLRESNNYQTMKREYELYKRGNMADVDYPSELAGKSVYIKSSLIFRLKVEATRFASGVVGVTEL